MAKETIWKLTFSLSIPFFKIDLTTCIFFSFQQLTISMYILVHIWCRTPENQQLQWQTDFYKSGDMLWVHCKKKKMHLNSGQLSLKDIVHIKVWRGLFNKILEVSENGTLVLTPAKTLDPSVVLSAVDERRRTKTWHSKVENMQ